MVTAQRRCHRTGDQPARKVLALDNSPSLGMCSQTPSIVVSSMLRRWVRNPLSPHPPPAQLSEVPPPRSWPGNLLHGALVLLVPGRDGPPAVTGGHRQLIERPFHGAGQDSSIRYGEDGPPTAASRLPPWLRQSW